MEIKIQFANSKRPKVYKNCKEWGWIPEIGVLAVEIESELIHYPENVIFNVTEKLVVLAEV